MIGRETIVKKILFTVLCLCAAFLLLPSSAVTRQLVTETEVFYQDSAESIEILNYTGSNSGWKNISGNFNSVSVKAKNYLSMDKSAESDSNIGYSMVLRVVMDNGKFYAFRIINDTKVRYAYSRFGADGASTGWDAWTWIDTKDSVATDLINGEGVEFKVERTAANILTVTINGTVFDTYTMDGVTSDNQVVSVGFKQYGNPSSSDYTVMVSCVATYPSPEFVKVQVADIVNGTVTTDKTHCFVGDTVRLTVSPDTGYAYKTLTINGNKVNPDINGVYSFVAQDSTYTVDASFTNAVFTENDDDKWNLIYQGVGELVMTEHTSGNSGWLKPLNNVSDITTTVKDYSPEAQDFSMIYKFTFENGETVGLRLNGTDTDGQYRIQVMNGSTLSAQWKNHYTLTSEQVSKLRESGINFRTAIEGLKAVVYLDGTKVCAIDLSKVVATGNASYIKNVPVRVELRMDGNLQKTVRIPYELAYNISWTGYQFDTDEIEQYVVVYDDSNPDYAAYAKQLADRINEKYGKTLKITPDTTASVSNCEILIGDTNRSDSQGKIMEYSVTVKDGKFRINVGGSCSAEKAIEYLCANVFDGQRVTLNNGEYYHTSLLTKNSPVTSGTTARVMSANVLADSFSGGSHKNANYRAEIFAGALISYTPDALGLQETDANWNKVLDTYLVKIQKLYGIKYSRYLATHEGKLNYTSLLYRSDKFKVEDSGVKVFSWWTDKNFNHNYHMRNITWAQFTSLTDANKKFVLANTHWSYRTEHDKGNTYLNGSSTPIATNELRTQCMNETNAFMTSLKERYSAMPIFLVGDFNTSLPFFTSYGWTPKSFNVISEQAKNNGTALSTVPTSNHFDHIFGTGNYTVKRYEFFNNVNQHSALTDHPFVYADLAF